MRQSLPAVVTMLLLASCSFFEPPACSDDVVDATVRELLVENAGTLLDATVDVGDPLSVIRHMALGVGMQPTGRLSLSPDAARAIRWDLANHRTSAINRELGIRTCSVDVSYGQESDVIGSFVLQYSVGHTDDGEVYVRLFN